MTTLVVSPVANTDDAYWVPSGATYEPDSLLYIGDLSGTQYNSLIRFPGITIPNGSTITSAYIELEANLSLSSALNAEILAAASDNASVPGSVAAADALSLGTAVAWNSVPSTTAGVNYSTPNISTALQEVVNRPGWASGNAALFVIRPVTPATSAYRNAETNDTKAGAYPTLTITYEAPSTGDFAGALPLFTIDASDNTGALASSLPAISLYATDVPGYLVESLPVLLTSADGIAGEVGAAAATLALIIVDSVGVNDSAINTLPVLTVAADTGSGGTSSLPALTISASTGSGGISSLPVLSLDAYGTGDGEAANTLPLLGAQASGAIGTMSAASGTIPALVLDAYAGSYALLEIPITLEASGLTGNVAGAIIQTPALTLAVAASQEGVGDADLTTPRLTLAAAGLAENDSSVSEVLRPIRLVASGVVGYAGDASIELPGIVLSAAAYTNNTATADNDTSAWYIDAEAFSAIAEAYRAWALNVRNAALTEYSGMAFNSFGVFQGRVLAAGATGLHVVGEADLDNATNIAALVRTAVTDFGTSYNKRVPRAYVGMKASQDMEFRTLTSQDGVRAYLIPRNGNPEVQQRRAPIGRGPKARFWQFELANRDGGDFTAVDILVYPEVTYRRVV